MVKNRFSSFVFSSAEAGYRTCRTAGILKKIRELFASGRAFKPIACNTAGEGNYSVSLLGYIL
jgi:hypothetical protein